MKIMTCVKYSALNRCQTCLGEPIGVSTIKSLHVSNDMVSILNYFNVQILEGLPNSICCKCVRTFESIITFKHQCVVSQTFLQNLFNEFLATNAPEDIKEPEEGKKEPVSDVFSPNVGIKVEEIKEEVEDDDATFETENFVKVDTNYSPSDDSSKKKVSPSPRKKKKKIVKEPKSETTGDISCNHCSFKCDTDQELKTHFQNKHETVCNICNKEFKHNRYLLNHKEVHEDRPKIYCEICKKFYNSKKTYEYHMKKLHEKIREKIVCSLCGIAVYAMNQHMRSKHDNSRDSFPCTYCPKVFKSNYRLRAHTLIFHENSERYASLCPECGKVFRTASEMKAHYKHKHTDTFDFQCRFCERKFKALKHCNKHEKTAHPHELPYKCSMCSKMFPVKSMLDEHIRTHTGEKL